MTAVRNTADAIEIRGLKRSFGKKQALRGLNMTVPQGAIYGLIGENGSGKSTTQKAICGLIHPDAGSIKLYGQAHTQGRSGIGVLIEAPGCYPDCSVWNNMQLQAANLHIKNPDAEIRQVLQLVHMEGAASNKYRNCSLGMKQRVGVAMALLGSPRLLILDEPLNGLDADGMRILREVLTQRAAAGCTVLISSHILGELEKIATHYGIIRNGRMLAQMTAQELTARCRTYTALQTADMEKAEAVLRRRYFRVERDESGFLRVYDPAAAEEIAVCLYQNGLTVRALESRRISLEEYYIDLMNEKEAVQYAAS